VICKLGPESTESQPGFLFPGILSLEVLPVKVTLLSMMPVNLKKLDIGVTTVTTPTPVLCLWA